MPSELMRPRLSLENFSTSVLAAARPAPLLQRDREELESMASDSAFWISANDRGEVASESISDLTVNEERVKILASYGIVQLVRVSLRNDYGASGMRRGAFNEATIFRPSDYAKALIGGIKVARKCDWAMHILPPAPVREPPPLPFDLPKRRDEPLSRIRRASSSSSSSSGGTAGLHRIAETPEPSEDEAEAIRRFRPICDQRQSKPPESDCLISSA